MLYNSIPVIMHHHVSQSDRELNVNPGVFEDQLRVMSNRGWKTLSGDEFLYFAKNRNEAPKKCVLLTFDDGFADNYVFAYPLLKKYGMKAMLFVSTDLVAEGEVNRDGFKSLSHNDAWALAFTERRGEVMCTWSELVEMEKSGVIDIQSHGVSHKTPDMIEGKKYEELRHDLSEGRAVLEQKLSKEILHFAWPRGGYDIEGIKIAEEVGYKALYTTERGTNTADSLLEIKRLPVKSRNGKWLCGKLPIYSSVFMSRLYLALRTGI